MARPEENFPLYCAPAVYLLFEPGGIYHEPTSRFYFFLNFPHLCKPPVLKKVWVVVGRKMADYYEQRGHRTGIYDGLERANWTAVTVVSSQRFELLQLAG